MGLFLTWFIVTFLLCIKRHSENPIKCKHGENAKVEIESFNYHNNFLVDIGLMYWVLVDKYGLLPEVLSIIKGIQVT